MRIRSRTDRRHLIASIRFSQRAITATVEYLNDNFPRQMNHPVGGPSGHTLGVAGHNYRHLAFIVSRRFSCRTALPHSGPCTAGVNARSSWFIDAAGLDLFRSRVRLQINAQTADLDNAPIIGTVEGESVDRRRRYTLGRLRIPRIYSHKAVDEVCSVLHTTHFRCDRFRRRCPLKRNNDLFYRTRCLQESV